MTDPRCQKRSAHEAELNRTGGIGKHIIINLFNLEVMLLYGNVNGSILYRCSLLPQAIKRGPPLSASLQIDPAENYGKEIYYTGYPTRMRRFMRKLRDPNDNSRTRHF